MARLIDADSLFEKLDENSWYDNADGDIAEDLVLSAPTIDPESLRLKAHWLYDGRTDEDGNLVCRCSCCVHGDRHSPGITVPYCWFCGAKMED